MATERDQLFLDAVADILAESTVVEVGVLKRALAEIVVRERHTLSFGSCSCAGTKGCRGHVPETTKVARRALGLSELPDRDRVPYTNSPASERQTKKSKKSKKKATGEERS